MPDLELTVDGAFHLVPGPAASWVAGEYWVPSCFVVSDNTTVSGSVLVCGSIVLYCCIGHTGRGITIWNNILLVYIHSLFNCSTYNNNKLGLQRFVNHNFVFEMHAQLSEYDCVVHLKICLKIHWHHNKSSIW